MLENSIGGGIFDVGKGGSVCIWVSGIGVIGVREIGCTGFNVNEFIIAIDGGCVIVSVSGCNRVSSSECNGGNGWFIFVIAALIVKVEVLVIAIVRVIVLVILGLLVWVIVSILVLVIVEVLV